MAVVKAEPGSGHQTSHQPQHQPQHQTQEEENQMAMFGDTEETVEHYEDTYETEVGDYGAMQDYSMDQGYAVQGGQAEQSSGSQFKLY